MRNASSRRDLRTSSLLEDEIEIAKRIEADIIFASFAPGSRLTEDDLMSRYGASRHYVRQALVQLERQGIVQREKNIGATVRSYSPSEVRQIYEVREMLTRDAVLLIPALAPSDLIDNLREIQKKYCSHIENKNLRGIHELNDTFHMTLFSACGNPYLVRLLQDFMGLTLPIRAKTLADLEGMQASRRDHDAMIELLAGRDRWTLARLCVDHMQPSKLDYLARISPNDDQPDR
jgi:DNA-binding GntR family transcriptional regulator